MRRCIWVVLALFLYMLLFFALSLGLTPSHPSPSELPTPLPPLPPQIPPEKSPQLPEPSPAQKSPLMEISEKVAPAADEEVAKEQTIPESKRGPELSEKDHRPKSPPKEIPEKIAPLADEELVREALEDPKSSVARSDLIPVAPELVINEVSPRAPTSIPSPKKPKKTVQRKKAIQTANPGESWRFEMPPGLVFKNYLGKGGFGQVFLATYQKDTVRIFFFNIYFFLISLFFSYFFFKILIFFRSQ